MLRKYQKFILMLCLWGAACCVYILWDSLSATFFQRFPLTRHTGHAHAQLQQPISPVGRAGLEVKDAQEDQPPLSKSQNGSQHGRLPGPQADAAFNESEWLPSGPENSGRSPPAKTVSGNSSSTSSSPSTSSSSSSSTSSSSSSSSLSSSSMTSSKSAKAATVNFSPAGMVIKSTSTDPRTRKLLCVRFTGRLGNELFEYSSTLGLALSSNRTPVFEGSKLLPNVLKEFRPFPSHLNRSEVEARCAKARVVGEVSCCKFKREMTQLDPDYDFKVAVYLQSYRYFEKHEDAIRKAVTFKDHIRGQAESIVKKLREKYPSSTLVGMHIRHGDMASPRGQKLGYPAADPGYIRKAMAYFSQLYPGCKFVLASDSIDWVKENFPDETNGTRNANGMEGVEFLAVNNEPAVDMAVLAAMDHVVTSFGSFSWWVGFLNGGKTVYMKNFIRANTFIGKSFNPGGKDYIYPGWIPL